MAKLKSAKRDRLWYRIVLYTILVILSLIFLFPIFDMVSMSLTAPGEMSNMPQPLLPAVPQWGNYYEVIISQGYYNGIPYFVLYFLNSLKVVVLYLIGALATASLAAYAFSKIDFAFKNKWFIVVLSTMMIPSAVTIIPMFIVYNRLGMINTQLPLWLPAFFGGGATNIFLLIQFMRGIPDSLLESAELDGAEHLRKLVQIVLPNCVPILLFIGLQTALTTWNDFFTPLLYITSKRELNTLALGVTNIMQSLSGGASAKQYLLMAACTLMSVFPVLLFVFGQKYFVESVTVTGMKE